LLCRSGSTLRAPLFLGGYPFTLKLGGDGNTLAVGANLEASNATGIDGDQTDNSMTNAGAVYLY
jgi:hypothetical protein